MKKIYKEPNVTSISESLNASPQVLAIFAPTLAVRPSPVFSAPSSIIMTAHFTYEVMNGGTSDAVGMDVPQGLQDRDVPRV